MVHHLQLKFKSLLNSGPCPVQLDLISFIIEYFEICFYHESRVFNSIIQLFLLLRLVAISLKFDLENNCRLKILLKTPIKE